MSEIEKMYENAKVKLVADVKFPTKDVNYNVSYPLFTAEKQIELIKWLAYKTHITIGKGLPWGQYDDDWWTITSKKGYTGTNAYKLEEALANFINSLWQDLTEEEKQQVKGLLE